MTKDLIANHLKSGMDRAAVIKLLGKDDVGDYNNNSRTLDYVVDRFSIDPSDKNAEWYGETLEITFDVKGKLLRTEILTG